MPALVLPKMMLGFVVRRCAVALGHAPSAAEFAQWANEQEARGEPCCLFGRPITEKEAAVILRHPERPVSARDAAPHEQVPDAEPVAPKVVALDKAAPHRATRAVAPVHARSRLRRR